MLKKALTCLGYPRLVSDLHKCTAAAKQQWPLPCATSNNRDLCITILAERRQGVLLLPSTGNPLLDQNLTRRHNLLHVFKLALKILHRSCQQSFDPSDRMEMMG